MHFLYKGAAVAGIVGTGGVGAFYGIKALNNTVKIKDQLKNRILPSDDSVKGGERLNDLKTLSSSDSLSPELSTFKISITSKKGEDMRNLCSNLSNQEFKNKEDKIFTEVVTYCTYKNKDKIGEKIVSSREVSAGTTLNERLKNEQGTLSTKMAEIQGQVKTNTSTATQLKDGCHSIYNKPFINDSDVELRDAKVYCVSK